MGTMKGFLGKLGFARGTTWGTAVALGAGHGYIALKDGIKETVEHKPREGFRGSIQQKAGDRGRVFHAGPISADAAYEELGLWLALVMGELGTSTDNPTIPVASESAYAHLMQIAKNVDGKFGTLGLLYENEVREYASAKVAKLSLKCDQSSFVAAVDYELVCDSLAVNTDSGTNTLTTIASLTYPANEARLLFEQLSILMNAQEGADFAATDDTVIAESFSIDIERGFRKDKVTTARGYLIDEPRENGFFSVKGSIGLADLNADNMQVYQDQLVLDDKKLKIAFTGPLATASVPYSLTLWLPHVKLMADNTPKIGDAGLTPWTVAFEAFEVEAAPTGFVATYTDMLNAVLVNTFATNYFA